MSIATHPNSRGAVEAILGAIRAVLPMEQYFDATVLDIFPPDAAMLQGAIGTAVLRKRANEGEYLQIRTDCRIGWTITMHYCDIPFEPVLLSGRHFDWTSDLGGVIAYVQELLEAWINGQMVLYIAHSGYGNQRWLVVRSGAQWLDLRRPMGINQDKILHCFRMSWKDGTVSMPEESMKKAWEAARRAINQGGIWNGADRIMLPSETFCLLPYEQELMLDSRMRLVYASLCRSIVSMISHAKEQGGLVVSLLDLCELKYRDFGEGGSAYGVRMAWVGTGRETWSWAIDLHNVFEVSVQCMERDSSGRPTIAMECPLVGEVIAEDWERKLLRSLKGWLSKSIDGAWPAM